MDFNIDNSYKILELLPVNTFKPRYYASKSQGAYRLLVQLFMKMTENDIRKKAVIEFQKEGLIYWFPPRAKFQQTDIFGVFDVIAVKILNGVPEIYFIQLTTPPNVAARRAKIKKFYETELSGHSFVHSWIWAYDKEKEKFSEWCVR